MFEDKISSFYDNFRENLQYQPTTGQDEAMHMLSEFLYNFDIDQLFMLKGYAGTGKTTLISSFVKTLDQQRIKTVLLAPTGRAAKVLGSYAGKKAHTIHRYLYWVFTKPEGGMNIIPRKNKDRDTIYIVDEVSMISASTNESALDGFGNRNILEDLFRYVYEAENCKMVFVGDTAQLPPVGTLLSPALDKDYLNASFNLQVLSCTLSDVVRQESDSGILSNATKIREMIVDENVEPPFLDLTYGDLYSPMGMELFDELSDAFYNDEQDGAVVITRSNKRANLYNQEIRNRILFKENEIEGGDLMMIVKNNYYWLPEDSKAGFIANGDIVELLRVKRIEEVHGFRFADVEIKMLDYPDESELEVKILLDTLTVNSANLPHDETLKLYHAVLEEQHGKKKGVSKDPFYNALQVKFAYALTCHKTQGGQWKKVFLDQGYLTNDMLDVEYMRWLYTAVTRSTNKLFLMGFKEEYVKGMDHQV